MENYMKKVNEIKIVCPNCGYEYLPAEIFLPNSFFGKPYYVIRDDKKKITSHYGPGMDLREKYLCDGCNKPLKIFATVDFQVEIDTENDFNEEYRTKIKKPSLKLEEK